VINPEPMETSMSMPGHNSGEQTAQERSADRMVIVRRLLDIQERMKPLLDERKKVRSEAKANFKLAEIDAAIRLATMEDQTIFVEEIKELIEIAKAFNALPPGEQGSLFPDRRDADERAYDAGLVAGLAGATGIAPPSGFDPGRWMEGWTEGQKRLGDAMQRDMERRAETERKTEVIGQHNVDYSSDPNQTDLEDFTGDDPFEDAEAAE
jgi:hypothetical protein